MSTSNIAGPDVEKAIALLQQAIRLHEKHMSGTAPTTGPAGMQSQMEMMRQMQGALKALAPMNNSLLGLFGRGHM